MYTRSRRQPVAGVEARGCDLLVDGAVVHTYDSPERARKAGNTYARMISVGCSPVVSPTGVVTANPTREQREALRDQRMVRR